MRGGVRSGVRSVSEEISRESVFEGLGVESVSEEERTKFRRKKVEACRVKSRQRACYA